MFSTDDTIVAIATPPGRGGLGVVRLSGPRVHEIAAVLLERRRPLEPRRATLTRTRRVAERVADQVVATLFVAPHSYTGEDVLELSAHGSPVVLHAIVRAAMDAGARLARPGEFTLRAFLAGRIDLVQAEAVADLIAAATPLQARIAFDQLEGTLTGHIAEIDGELFDLIARLEASLDFPDEGYHFVIPADVGPLVARVVTAIDALLEAGRAGRTVREGATVVIAGRPNAGKSSLFNKLAGFDRAIVTDVPGTTRDLVTERVDIGGLAITLVDTAGARESRDPVEREGVARGAQARGVADAILLVLDRSVSLNDDDLRLLDDTRAARRVIVASKCDRPSAEPGGVVDAIEVSAQTGDGLERLREAIVSTLVGSDRLRDTAAVSNVRHLALLERARTHLLHSRAAVENGATEEFVLSDLHAARACFDEIVGTRTNEDLLQYVFERFCIGK